MPVYKVTFEVLFDDESVEDIYRLNIPSWSVEDAVDAGTRFAKILVKKDNISRIKAIDAERIFDGYGRDLLYDTSGRPIDFILGE